MDVMLLAAGEGTRLRPFTIERPKPAIPLLGVPLLGYSLQFIEPIQVQNLVVNLFHLPEKMRLSVERMQFSAQKLVFSLEADGLLGGGGGVHKAQGYLGSGPDFLMLNADEVLIPFSAPYMEHFYRQHADSKAIATIMVKQDPQVGKKFGGVWTRDEKNVVQFARQTPSGGLTGHHFIGPILFSSRIFKYFKPTVDGKVVPENILYETLTAAIAAGEQVQIHDMDGLWFETGNREDFLLAQSTLKEYLAHGENQFSKEYLRRLVQKYGGERDVVV